MLDLPSVTACCVDTLNHDLALRALRRSMAGTRFGNVIFFTDRIPECCEVPPQITVVPGVSIASLEDYSRFVLKQMLPHVHTSHVLLLQWDGYVTQPAAWNPEFLRCDYLGATWPWLPAGEQVGNGGFSLRSRKLLEVLQDPRIIPIGWEDQTICGAYRSLLRDEFGIRFGSDELANSFSFESNWSRILGGEETFGFHGVFNLCFVEPVAEVIDVCGRVSDEIAASIGFEKLMGNLALASQWTAVEVLAARIMASSPGNVNAAEKLAHARDKVREASAAQLAPTGRIRRLLSKWAVR